MAQNQLLYPLFVQILLTFILLFRMGYLRFVALKQKQVKIKDIALGQGAWTENATKVERSFNSQFEMPILFYKVILVGLFLRIESNFFLISAWIFVISRILHSFIHSTSNHVPLRFRFFLIGVIVLLAMWLIVAFSVI